MNDKMIWHDNDVEPNCASLRAEDNKKIASLYRRPDYCWELRIYVFNDTYANLGKLASLEEAKKAATLFIHDECKRRIEYYHNAMELLPDLSA